MKRVIVAVVLVLVACAPALAASKLLWDMPAPTPDAATAQSYVYKYYLDGATTPLAVATVTCSGTTTITCQATFPTVPPGQHTLTLVAYDGGPESAPSPILTFKVTGGPNNPRIVQ